MDTIRSIGSKVVDKVEKIRSKGIPNEAATGSTAVLLVCLVSIQSIIRILSDITAGLWQQARVNYLVRISIAFVAFAFWGLASVYSQEMTGSFC